MCLRFPCPISTLTDCCADRYVNFLNCARKALWSDQLTFWISVDQICVHFAVAVNADGHGESVHPSLFRSMLLTQFSAYILYSPRSYVVQYNQNTSMVPTTTTTPVLQAEHCDTTYVKLVKSHINSHFKGAGGS
jgi:hypothetical protein